MSTPTTTPITDTELAAAIAELPPVSMVLQRSLVVLSDPHSDLDDIARLIRAETVLAARVVRLANSAVFGLTSPVGSIEEAIQRLGFGEVHSLVCALASRQLFLRTLTHANFAAEQLWAHALAVAVSAETLARLARSDRSVAYLAGILHPVGIFVIDHLARARGLAPRAPEEPVPDWEHGHFGTDNAAVGARVLRHWKFPENLAAIIAGRYHPGAAGEHTAQASLLHAASILAEKLGAALPGERGLFLPSAERLTAAGLPWEEFGDAEIEAAQNLQRTRALLNLA